MCLLSAAFCCIKRSDTSVFSFVHKNRQDIFLLRKHPLSYSILLCNSFLCTTQFIPSYYYILQHPLRFIPSLSTIPFACSSDNILLTVLIVTFSFFANFTCVIAGLLCIKASNLSSFVPVLLFFVIFLMTLSPFFPR